MDARHPASVTIYLPTEPVTDGERERIGMKNAVAEAVAELHRREVDKRDVATIEHQLDELVDDAHLWSHAARTLAVFATPESVRAFRLPNHLHGHVIVGDRFFTKPLLRAVTFPHTGYVLRLSQHEAKLMEILPEGVSFEMNVPTMPNGVDHATAASGAPGRAPRKSITSAEGDKVRMAQYARRVDQALRPVLDGTSPLIIAAAEPLASIFSAACTYPLLSHEVIGGNPETTSTDELTERGRVILDQAYHQQLAQAAELFEQRRSNERAVSDVADVARAATLGMVDTVFVDIDDVLWGRIDESTGAVTYCDAEDLDAYGIVDEIVRRVWDAGGTVMAVRSDEVPGGDTVAAILRYPLS
jgi:hypothetical protein